MGGTASAEQQVHDLILKSQTSKEAVEQVNRLLNTTTRNGANVAPLLRTSEKSYVKFAELLSDHASLSENDLIAVLKVGQLLLKTSGMYASLAKANLDPVISIFKSHVAKPNVILALLGVVQNIVECNTPAQPSGCCAGQMDPDVFRTKAASASREAFSASGGMNQVMDTLWRVSKALDELPANVLIATMALETIASYLLISYNPYFNAASTRKLIEALKPHQETIMNFLTKTGEANVKLRCAAARVVQGLILHSNSVEAKAIQDLILTQGYLLYILFGSISHKPHPNVQLTSDMQQILAEHANVNGHKSAEDTIKAFRGLLSLTVDHNANVETTLTRVIPRGLCAYASTPRSAPLPLALEKPLAKGRVPEIQNLVWYQYHENSRKVFNWDAVLSKIDESISQPTLLWTPLTRMELLLAVGNEVRDLDSQREANPKSSWDYEGFEVEYPSLGVHLKIGDYFAHILLPLIEGANNYQIPQQDLAPLVSAAFQRAVIEDDSGWKLACIRTMSCLYKHYASVLKDADAIPYLVWLLSAENKTVNPLWRDHILTFLESLFQSQLNTTKFVKAGGIKVLEYYLNLAHLPSPIVRIQLQPSAAMNEAHANKSITDPQKPIGGELKPKASIQPNQPAQPNSNIASPTVAPNPQPPKRTPPKPKVAVPLADSDDERETENNSPKQSSPSNKSDSNDEDAKLGKRIMSTLQDSDEEDELPVSDVVNNASHNEEKQVEDIEEMLNASAAKLIEAGEVNDVSASGVLPDVPRATRFSDRRSSRGGRRIEPCYINFLERDSMLEGISAPMTNANVAARVLKLIEDIVNNAPRLRRAVFKETLQDTLTNLLLCPLPELSDRALGLLNILLEANGHVLGRLHEKGTFLFVLYASREKFSSNAIIFVDRYHKKPYIAREKKTTVLYPYLPQSVAAYADRKGGAKLIELLEKDVESPTIIWSSKLRAILNDAVTEQVQPFIDELRKDPHLAQYEYCPPPQLRYPQLDNELCVANIFVRIFNQLPDEPIDDPEYFFSELVRVFGEEIYKGDNVTELMRAQIHMCSKLPESVTLRPYSAMQPLLRLLEACPRPYDFHNAHLRVGVRLLRLVLMTGKSGNAQKCIEAGGAILLARMLKEIGTVCASHFESEKLDADSVDNFDLLNQVLNALTEMLAFSESDKIEAKTAESEVKDESQEEKTDSAGKSTGALHTLFEDLTLTRSLMRLVSGLLKSNVAALRAQLVTSAVRFVSFLINHSAHAVEHLLDAGIVLDAVYLALYHDAGAAQLHAKQNEASALLAAPVSRGHSRKMSHIPDMMKAPETEVDVRHASASLLASLLKVPGAAEETQFQIQSVLRGLLSPGLVSELRLSPAKFVSLIDKDTRSPTLIWNAEVKEEVRQHLQSVIEARNKSAGGTWIQARAPFTFRIKPVREEVMVLDIYLGVYNELKVPFLLPAPITEATFLNAIINYAAVMCVKAASSIKNILPLPVGVKELAEHPESIRRTLGTATDESHPRALVCAVSIRKIINEHPELLTASLKANFEPISSDASSPLPQEGQPSPSSPTATPASPRRGRSGSVCLSASSSLQNAKVVLTENIKSLSAFLALLTLQDSRLEHEVLCMVYTIASSGKEGMKVLLHIACYVQAMLDRPRNYITDYPRLPLVFSLLQMIMHSETGELKPKILTALLENGFVASLMLIIAKGEVITRAVKTATLSYKRFTDKNLNLDTLRSSKTDGGFLEAMRLGVGCVTFDLPYRQAVAKLLIQLVKHVHVGSLFKEALISLLTVPFAAHLSEEVKFLTVFDSTIEAPDFFWNSACRSDLTDFLLTEVVEIVKHQNEVLTRGKVFSADEYPKYPYGINYYERFDRPTLDAQIVIEAPYIYVYPLNKMPYFKNLDEHAYYAGLLQTLGEEYKELSGAISLSQQARVYKGENPPTKQEIQEIDNFAADRRNRVAALLQSLRTKTKDVPQEQPNVVPYLDLLTSILAEESVNCPDTETNPNVIIDHCIALFATLATQEQIALQMAVSRVAAALVPHLYPVCVHRYSKKLLSSDENYTKRTIFVLDALQDLVRRSTPVVLQYINLGIGAFITNMLLTPNVYNQTLRHKATEVILLMGQDSSYGYEAIVHFISFLTIEFSDELCKTPELVLKMLDTPHQSELCKRTWNANVKEKLAARLREILPELIETIQTGNRGDEPVFHPDMIESVFAPYPKDLDIKKIVANARQLALGTLSANDVTVGNMSQESPRPAPPAPPAAPAAQAAQAAPATPPSQAADAPPADAPASPASDAPASDAPDSPSN